MNARSVMLLAWVLLGQCAFSQAADEGPSVSSMPLDFGRAATDDKAGDYARAQEEYETLAAIGQAAADFNLGVMSLKGRLRDAGPAATLGWFSAAQQLGMTVPDLAAMQAGADALAQRRAGEILAQYGKSAVGTRLETMVRECALGTAPGLADGTMDQISTQPKVTRFKFDGDPYPQGALHQGQQSIVLVTTVIDIDGHARDPRIEVAVPDDPKQGFEDQVIQLVLRSSYKPAMRDGLPIAVRVPMPVRFNIGGGDLWDRKILLQLQSKARQGDPNAQFSVATIGMLDKQAKSAMSLSTDDEIHLAVSAALGGYRAMQYWMAQELGRVTCHEDVAARSWLMHAAAAGSARAQLDLAQQGIDAVAAVDPRAVMWLRKAAESQDPYVIKHVAWIMATSSAPSVRDPATALRLARQLPDKSGVNPELDTVLSAALAANGDFNGARAAMQQALKKAKRLGWDDAQLRSLLQSYIESRAVQDAPLVVAAEQANLLRDGPMD